MKRAGGYTLITGASSGMGEATAKLLSATRNLVLHGRDEARLADVGEACAANGADVVLFPFDLEQADTVGSALTALLKEKEAPVEAFVHFAGMTEVLPISKTKYSVGLRVMNVNYFSATEIISALLKKKSQRQSSSQHCFDLKRSCLSRDALSAALLFQQGGHQLFGDSSGL